MERSGRECSDLGDYGRLGVFHLGFPALPVALEARPRPDSSTGFGVSIFWPLRKAALAITWAETGVVKIRNAPIKTTREMILASFVTVEAISSDSTPRKTTLLAA